MRARSRQPERYMGLCVALAMACSCAPALECSSWECSWDSEELPFWGGPAIWVESPMVKVRPGTAPGSRRRMDLFAARNEFVSFQVVFHGGQTGMTIDSVSLPSL